MKILYHHRTQGKGAEGVHIREIVKSLKQLENEVYMVSPPGIDPLVEERPNAGKQSRLAKMWKWISGHLPEVWFELLELAYNFIGYKNIKKVIKKEKIDFIYERYSFFCFAGVYLAKKHNIPIILEVNEISGIRRMRGQVLVKLAKRIEKWVFNKADAIVTVSSFLKKQIESRGINSSKIYVIPNAVNEEDFNVNVDGLRIREKLNLKGKTVLTFMGHFSRWDNLDFLVDNFDDITKKREDTHLMIVGDGNGRKALEEIIESKGLRNRVSLVGKVERKKIPEYIAAADICVIPHSNPFGSPIVLFEYMAMGKAVVAARLSPIEEIIKQDVNGLLFIPGHEKSFKEAVINLIDDWRKRESIGIQARNTILAKHLWTNNTRQILCIYDRLKNENKIKQMRIQEEG